MANRTFSQSINTLFKKVVKHWAIVSVSGTTPVLQQVNFRATGAIGVSPSTSVSAAPTSGPAWVFGDGPDGGVMSVARTGAGAWTFTLKDSYQRLLGVSLLQTASTTGLLTSGFGVGVDTDLTNVTTNTGLGNGGTIGIVLNNGSGAATDPATGDVLTFEITLLDATEP